jgi:hypothetical protein
MPLRTLLACTVFLALLACGKETLPQKPQLFTDRNSLGFGLEFNSGTYIGSAPPQSLLIENQGLDTLHLQSVSISGDAAFTMDQPPKTELKGKEHTFLRVVFTPTEVKSYSATITIISDAENLPTKTIAVTGRGIQPGTDGG